MAKQADYPAKTRIVKKQHESNRDIQNKEENVASNYDAMVI